MKEKTEPCPNKTPVSERHAVHANEAPFRRLFRPVVGITPSEYRREDVIPDFAELPDPAAQP